MSEHPDPPTDTDPADDRPASGPPDDAEDFSPQGAELDSAPTEDDEGPPRRR